MLIPSNNLDASTIQGNRVPIISYEYPPYTSNELESGGMRTQIVQAAYKAASLNAQVTLYPTMRAKQLFINTPNLTYMGILSHFPEEAQENLLFIPLMPIRLAVFYYAPSFPNAIYFQKPEDLQGFSVGTMFGSVTAKKLRQANVEVQEQTNLDGLIKKLHGKRIDFAAMTDLFGVRTSIKLFPNEYKNFKQLPNPLMEAWIGLVFHKTNPKAQERAMHFKAGMKEIIKTGEYLAIIQSYYENEAVPDNIQLFISQTSNQKGPLF